MTTPADNTSHRFSVAPMMEWTTSDCRYFLRKLSSRALLYTEMVTTGALIHGDTRRFLAYDEEEHPLALQLGGSDPAALAHCARIATSYGYDEINLNAGCPSDRVQNNKIGACLMAEPALVRDCLASMRDATDTPVTLKTRIGIDDMDSDQALVDFIGIVAQSGIDTVILHARIAILQGLSPKQNREIPPLNYSRAALIRREFPELRVVLNGGIRDMKAIRDHLNTFDGVMVGREAYQNPWLLSQVDQQLYGEDSRQPDRRQVAESMIPYIERQLARGASLHHITRHMLGLFQGCPGGRRYRRHLSENAWKPGAGIEVLLQALACTEFSRPGDEQCAAS